MFKFLGWIDVSGEIWKVKSGKESKRGLMIMTMKY